VPYRSPMVAGASPADSRVSARSRISGVPSPWIVVGVLLAIAIVLVALALTQGKVTPTRGESVVRGPFILDNKTASVGLFFPSCSFVTVQWADSTGAKVNFTVWPAPNALLGAICAGPPPSNATCPPAWGDCYTSFAPGPICFEDGASGMCSFVSNDPPYDFTVVTWLPGLIAIIGVDNSTLAFVVSYS
jgi:hypothetical protein